MQEGLRQDPKLGTKAAHTEVRGANSTSRGFAEQYFTSWFTMHKLEHTVAEPGPMATTLQGRTDPQPHYVPQP